MIKKIVSGFRIFRRDGLLRFLHLLLIKFCGLLVRVVNVVRGKVAAYNPYADLALLKPIRCDVISVDYDAKTITVPFSLISTVKNESANIVTFLQSIAAQSLKPNEIVIVDGGSTDQTYELIHAYATEAGLPLSLFKLQNCNIAEGRNRALAACSHEIVVLTDAGCMLDEDFCLNLVGGFAAFSDADLVGGVWTSAVSTGYNLQTPVWDQVQWNAFLPSARSMAVKKSICERIGGFPEYLTLTGEDTLFDISYRRVSQRWVFNRNAFVYWHAPISRERERKVAFNYGMGDGENGVGDFSYYHLLKGSTFLQRMAIISPEEYAGYLKGRRNRSTIEIQRRNINGLVIILSALPISDSDGKQRGAQLAFEFIEQNYKVIFVNMLEHHEEFKTFLQCDYSLLELYTLNDFDCDELVERYHALTGRILVVSVAPIPVFIPVIKYLKKSFDNCQYVFDCTDAWESSSANEWYDRAQEDILLSMADILCSPAQELADTLAARTGRTVVLLPPALQHVET